MTQPEESLSMPTTAGRVFSEQLYRIRDVHIEVESILQAWLRCKTTFPAPAAPASAARKSCVGKAWTAIFCDSCWGPWSKAIALKLDGMCRARGAGSAMAGHWCVMNSFAKSSNRRIGLNPGKLSRALKKVYANVFAGQHMLVVEDISRITANKLNIIYGRLENLRELANATLRTIS